MGRKTFESIGRALPGRETIVVTGQAGYRATGCRVVPDLSAALAACATAGEVFICGGEPLYRESLALAEWIYLTVVHREYPGDAFFPPIPDAFTVTGREELAGTPPCTFLSYRRLPPENIS
jgi:dihydrofolate reductase